MLAGLKGLDGDLHMPVIGGDDADDVDVVAVEHFPVVAVGIGLPLAEVVVVAGPLGVPVVDVADGEDVAEVGMLLGVAGAHRAGADAADPRPVVGSRVGKRLRGPGEGGDKAAGDRRGAQRRRTEELTARGAYLARHGNESPLELLKE